MAKLYLFCVFVALANQVAAQSSTLRTLAEHNKKYIGFAVNPGHLLHDADIIKLADREFDCFTPENAMKWVHVESSRGHFNFTDGDVIVEHGHKHGQKIRGHTLVWHHLPAWVENGHFNATELSAILRNHIHTEVTHYKGKIYAWDVVNEALNDKDGSYRTTVFYNTLGKSYIADAFKVAHEADPAAKLYYNDYSVEGINHKSDAMLAMVKELLAQNVPIHGVGLQAHFSAGHVPHDLQKNMERFAALGLDVAITEVDVRVQLPVNATKLEQQAQDYAEIWKACMAVSRCVGVTTWGVTDKYSWIPAFFHGWGAGLMYDEHFKEKAAVGAIKKVLQAVN